MQQNRQNANDVIRHNNTLIPTTSRGNTSIFENLEDIPARTIRLAGDLLKNKIKSVNISQQQNSTTIGSRLVNYGDAKYSYGPMIDEKIRRLDKKYSDWAWGMAFGSNTNFEEGMECDKGWIEYNSLMLNKPSNIINGEVYKMIESGKMEFMKELLIKTEIITKDYND